jgi:hypothetical protein
MWRVYVFFENITILTKTLLHPRAIPYLAAMLLVPIFTVRNRNWLTTSVNLWILGAILTLVPCTQAGVRHYLTFFQLPLALAVGNLAHLAWSKMTVRSDRGTFAASMALCIPLALFGFELSKLKHDLDSLPPKIDHSRLSALTDSSKELQSLAGPSRRIFFEGSNLMPLFQSGLLPASKYIYAVPMSIIPPQTYEEELLAQVKASQPQVALLTHYSPVVYAPTQNSTQGRIGAYLTENFDPPHTIAAGTVFVKKATQAPSQ